MLPLLPSIAQSTGEVSQVQGLGKRLHPLVGGAAKSHGQECGDGETVDWAHR